MILKMNAKKISIGLLLSIVVLMVTLAMGWSRSAFEVGPEDANARIHQRFNIPQSARKVSYDSTPRSTMVTFTVPRKDFEAWAERMRFQTRIVTPEDPASRFVFTGRGQFVFEILEDGLEFHSQQTCGIGGTFGFKDELCSATFSCR